MSIDKRYCFGVLLAMLYAVILPAYGKPCSLRDFQNQLSDMNDIMLYKTFQVGKARFSLQYDKSKHILIGKYAEPNFNHPLKLYGHLFKNGTVYLKSKNSNKQAGWIKLKFRNYGIYNVKNYGLNNPSCSALDGVVSLHGGKKHKIHLYMNGENSPLDLDEQTKNEKTVQRLKEIATDGSRSAFAKLLNYPILICYGGQYSSTSYTSSNEVIKNYNKIMTKGEKEFLSQTVPFMLNTTAVGSDYADDTIFLGSGLIYRMCIQYGYSTVQVDSCPNCP